MNSNLLGLYHTFEMVVKTGSISGAAKELYISQPAVSKSIKKLEEALSTPLIVRQARGIILTDEGKLLHDHLSNAFDIISSGENDLKHINTLGIGRIRIGVSSTLCKHMLLPYLKTFLANHPHIQVVIQCQSTRQTIQLLENNEIDFGLIAQPEANNNLNYIQLGQIQDLFVASPQYVNRLMERDNIDFASVLSHSSLILLDKQNMTRRYVDKYLTSWNIDTSNALEINSMELLIDFAKTGLGAACSIAQFIEKELACGELIALIEPETMAKRKVCFAYANNIPTTSAVQAFIEHITR